MAYQQSGAAYATAIIGDAYQNITTDYKGFAFIYLGLDTTTGLIAEDLQLVASDGVSNNRFGSDIAIGADGDSFIMGAYGADRAAATSGKAYSGTISSLTTLDKGNTSHEISKISFVSYHDWIIGKNNSNNSVSLGAGDSAEIASDTGTVTIGQNAGSNGNLLTIKRHLTAQEIFIGSTQGNTGNTFRLEETATFTIDTLYLVSGTSSNSKANTSTSNPSSSTSAPPTSNFGPKVPGKPSPSTTPSNSSPGPTTPRTTAATSKRSSSQPPGSFSPWVPSA